MYFKKHTSQTLILCNFQPLKFLENFIILFKEYPVTFINILGQQLCIRHFHSTLLYAHIIQLLFVMILFSEFLFHLILAQPKQLAQSRFQIMFICEKCTLTLFLMIIACYLSSARFFAPNNHHILRGISLKIVLHCAPFRSRWSH